MRSQRLIILKQLMLNLLMASLRLRPSSRIVSTTSCLNSGVYRLFGTPFGIKITPLVIQYIILSNKWGAVHFGKYLYYFFFSRLLFNMKIFLSILNIVLNLNFFSQGSRQSSVCLISPVLNTPEMNTSPGICHFIRTGEDSTEILTLSRTDISSIKKSGFGICSTKTRLTIL